MNRNFSKYIIACFLLMTGNVSVAHAQSFAPAVNYPVSSSPQGVTVADFDRDGKLDVVSVNSAGAISFLKGNGDGTFNAPVDYATGPQPQAITKGDFNHDGFLDVVVIDWTQIGGHQTHSTLLGNGNGSFQPRISFGPGSVVTSIATGDFDGDSNDDLITLDSNVGVVVVRLSNGDGTFRVASTHVILTSTRDLVIHDFNRDGKLDVAVTIENSIPANTAVGVFLGNGNGTLQTAVRYPAAADFISQIAAGDLNGDGFIDLLATSLFSGGRISFLRGNGDGTFQPRVDTIGPGSSRLAVADLDVDGKLDVMALRRNASSLAVFPGNGDGTLRLPFSEYGVNVLPTAIVPADLNGDGKTDFVISADGNVVSVFLNQTGPLSISGSITDGSGNPIDGVTVTLTGATPIKVTTGLNGLYSFTGLTNNGSYTVTPSKSNYGFTPTQQIFGNLDSNQTANFTGTLLTFSISGFVRDAAGVGISGVTVHLSGDATAMTTTDFDGRYLFPLLAGNANYTVTPSSPGRVFSPPSQTFNFLSSNRIANFSISVATFALNVAVRDPNLTNFFINPVVTLNGTIIQRGATTTFNGLPVGSNNTVTVAQTDAPFTPFVLRAPVSQTFNNLSSNLTANFEAKILGFNAGIIPNGIAPGDFNGDMKVDVVVASSNASRVNLLLGNGDGTLQSPTLLLTANGVFLPVAADFNHDGKLDVAVVAFIDNTVSVLLGNGNGTFQPVVAYQVGAGPQGLDVGDLNGDGKLDLVTANQSGGVSVLVGNGDGTFQASVTYAVASPRYITLGDLNGDNKLDAIAGSSVLLGNGDGTLGAAVSFTNANPFGGVTSDFNSDGKLDLAITNFNQGVGVFFGKGDGTFQSPVTYPITSNQEQIVVGDLNGDGKRDLVVTSSFRFTLLINNGDGSFQDFTEFSFGSFDPRHLAIADFNNDALPDLIFGHNINSDGRVNIFLNQMQTGIQFSASSYSVDEAAGRAQITVIRTGNVNVPSTLTYATIDDPAAIRCDTVNGTAYARCDYATTIDSLQFDAGETQKTLTIPVTDDGFVEGNETFQIALSNASGGVLSAKRIVTVTILDNDTPGRANPILANEFFVRQQYLDFLSREPEPAGFNAWVNVLANCSDVNNNPTCDRVTVSSSFFGAQEFQLKGFFVFRFYMASFGRRPSYSEMISDMRAVTGQTSAEVFAKRAAFANSWVTRPDFASYNTATNATFVALLMNRYGLEHITTRPPSDPEAGAKVTLTRSDLSNQLDSGVFTRAQVLRAIAESDEVAAAEFNKAFVAMQYFGFLRRDPETAGYDAWLNYLNQNPSDFRTMVNGFVNSVEYQLRFGTTN